MSEIPELEVIEAIQVPVWRMPTQYKNSFWDPQWRTNREKDLADVRAMLAHLVEYEDWFFVNVYAEDVDVFFTDKKQAVYFKLRHVM